MLFTKYHVPRWLRINFKIWGTSACTNIFNELSHAWSNEQFLLWPTFHLDKRPIFPVFISLQIATTRKFVWNNPEIISFKFVLSYADQTCNKLAVSSSKRILVPYMFGKFYEGLWLALVFCWCQLYLKCKPHQKIKQIRSISGNLADFCFIKGRTVFKTPWLRSKVETHFLKVDTAGKRYLFAFKFLMLFFQLLNFSSESVDLSFISTRTEIQN